MTDNSSGRGEQAPPIERRFALRTREGVIMAHGTPASLRALKRDGAPEGDPEWAKVVRLPRRGRAP